MAVATTSLVQGGGVVLAMALVRRGQEVAATALV